MKNSQNPRSLLGKLLRIDVESSNGPYVIPPDNPFVGDPNYAHEIWAVGLRNPWRFSFDRETGDLFIADVGHDYFEEIDFQESGSRGGQNYGWSMWEGPVTYYGPGPGVAGSELTAPVASYSHFSGVIRHSAAIIGGYVYRGTDEPRLRGHYLSADYISGVLRDLIRQGTNWATLDVGQTQFNPSTFGEDEQGRLFLADYTSGAIYQIHDSRETFPPSFDVSSGTLFSNRVRVPLPRRAP